MKVDARLKVATYLRSIASDGAGGINIHTHMYIHHVDFTAVRCCCPAERIENKGGMPPRRRLKRLKTRKVCLLCCCSVNLKCGRWFCIELVGLSSILEKNGQRGVWQKVTCPAGIVWYIADRAGLSCSCHRFALDVAARIFLFLTERIPSWLCCALKYLYADAAPTTRHVLVFGTGREQTKFLLDFLASQISLLFVGYRFDTACSLRFVDGRRYFVF